MTSTTPRSYGYRWVVLLAFMAVIFVNQLLWISFASITGPAARYYGVTDLAIAALALSFMVVYIFVSVPASWVIDTWGLRVGVGIGAVLTGVFGLLRGFAGDNYTLVLAAADRHRGRPALPAQRHYHGRGALVPDRGTGDRLRTWHAGHVRRPGHRAGADALPGAGKQHSRHADHLRSRGGDRCADLPRLRQGAPADACLG